MDRLSRDARWNLSLAVLVLSSALVAATGTAWAWFGTVLGGVVVLGAVLAVAACRAARRRDPWQRFLRGQAEAEAEAGSRARHPSARRPIRAAGGEPA